MANFLANVKLFASNLFNSESTQNTESAQVINEAPAQSTESTQNTESAQVINEAPAQSTESTQSTESAQVINEAPAQSKKYNEELIFCSELEKIELDNIKLNNNKALSDNLRKDLKDLSASSTSEALNKCVKQIKNINEVRFNEKNALKDLEYFSVFGALSMLNYSVKSVKLEELASAEELIDVKSEAPAPELAKLLKILGFKKFMLKDLIFAPVDNSDIIWRSASRASLLASACKYNKVYNYTLCTIKRTQRAKLLEECTEFTLHSGKKIKLASAESAPVYVFSALGKNINSEYKVTLKDIARSIFARYASEIAKYNNELNKAISSANKKAIKLNNEALFSGTERAFEAGRANYLYTELCKEYKEVFKDVKSEESTESTQNTESAQVINEAPAQSTESTQKTFSIDILRSVLPAQSSESAQAL